MDNAAIQVINRDYRDKDQPTDVISFALEEETEEELPIIFMMKCQLCREILGIS